MTRIAVIDSFTDRLFAGNPAGVCLLDHIPPDAWMQALAAEMRHSETAFVLRQDADSLFYQRWGLEEIDARLPGRRFLLRWFTPAAEVDLCGHATLAAAHVLRESGEIDRDTPVHFATRSGRLTVQPAGDLLRMDFPAIPTKPADPPPGLLQGLNLSDAVFVGRGGTDYLVELSDEDAVRAVIPDHAALRELDVRGAIVTAPGDGDHDAVSRFFAPGVGVDEDPVTGSAHCVIGPYWAEKLGKDEVRCWQASQRGGEITVQVRGNRVDLVGRATTVLHGELAADPPDADR